MQKSARGFTLVELLVVITILAILATIGFTIFTGTQKAARDTKRRADIDSIATAMEVNYGKYSPGQYSGLCQVNEGNTNPDCTKWFSGGLPSDPQASATIRYCWIGSGTCNNTTGTALASGNPPPNTANWVICATLETSTTPYCVSNRQ